MKNAFVFVAYVSFICKVKFMFKLVYNDPEYKKLILKCFFVLEKNDHISMVNNQVWLQSKIIFFCLYTDRFTDLGKLNFLMVARF